MIYTVRIEKLKYDYDKLSEQEGFKQKIKSAFSNIQKSIFNNTQEVMQETLLNGYYFSFFKKLKKEMQQGQHLNIKSIDFVENSKKVLEVSIDLKNIEDKEDGLNNLEWCLYDIKLNDAFSSAKNKKKLEKTEKKMIKNFVDSVTKENKGKRFSIGKVKDYFKNVWNENINKSIRDVCLKFSLLVVIK